MLSHISQNLPGIVWHSPQVKLFRHGKENIGLRHGLDLAAGPVVLFHQKIVHCIQACVFFIALLCCEVVAKNRQRIAYTGFFKHFAVKVKVVGFVVHKRLQCALGGIWYAALLKIVLWRLFSNTGRDLDQSFRYLLSNHTGNSVPSAVITS